MKRELPIFSVGNSARGVIAIGNVAHGVVAIGGSVSTGVIAIGTNAAGVFAIGLNAAGPVALTITGTRSSLPGSSSKACRSSRDTFTVKCCAGPPSLTHTQV